ncbi:MAG: hypothetical protein C4555_05195 [Dehalococcoidia bacterium]|nr:MAG: hypothetical protein C4555_05195 [Dehalococcoidia bacterium]
MTDVLERLISAAYAKGHEHGSRKQPWNSGEYIDVLSTPADVQNAYNLGFRAGSEEDQEEKKWARPASSRTP